MIGKINNGMSFKGLMQYVQGKMCAPGEKIAAFLDSEGVDMNYGADGALAPDATNVAVSFRLQANLNRKVKRPVKHFVLSWSEKDLPKLPRERMVELAREYLKAMGYVNTQHLIALHMEKNNPHIHIIVNAVDNEGKRINDYQERKRNIYVCRDITLKHGLTWGDHKTVSQAEIPTDRPDSAREHARYLIARKIAAAVSESKDIDQLPLKLIRYGVVTKVSQDPKTGQPRGISFSWTDTSGRKPKTYKFAGSAVDKRFSYRGLANIIELTRKFPTIRRHAQEILEMYDSSKYEYDIPEYWCRQCEKLREKLTEVARKEYRLKHEMKEGLTNGVILVVLSVAFGTPLTALTMALTTTFVAAMRSGRIARVDAKRQDTKRLLNNVSRLVPDPPEEKTVTEKDSNSNNNGMKFR